MALTYFKSSSIFDPGRSRNNPMSFLQQMWVFGKWLFDVFFIDTVYIINRA